MKKGSLFLFELWGTFIIFVTALGFLSAFLDRRAGAASLTPGYLKLTELAIVLFAACAGSGAMILLRSHRVR
jgi:hypothetical protein